MIGGPGDDLILGGVGNDFLVGSAGRNLVYGEAGNDTLHSGIDAEVLDGGAGDDVLVIEAGDVPAGASERLEGGEGMDTLVLIGFEPVEFDFPNFAVVDPLTGGRYDVRGVEQLEYRRDQTAEPNASQPPEASPNT